MLKYLNPPSKCIVTHKDAAYFIRIELAHRVFADIHRNNVEIHIENELDLREKIQQHRSLFVAKNRARKVLQEQIAKLGTYVPPHIVIEIEDAEVYIKEQESIIEETKGMLIIPRQTLLERIKTNLNTLTII